MALYPSLAQVTEATPAKRDRVIDVVRLASLIVVVCAHGLMALVVFDGDRIVMGNLVAHSEFLQELTWVFQILPLFFFAGVAASVHGWKPDTSWGPWLLRRCQRLYRPVFYYLAFWAVALVVLSIVMPEGYVRPVAALSVQLLWFVGIYVIVLATVPLLARIRSTAAALITVAALCAGVFAVDAIRLAGGPEAVGYLNFWIAWLVPGALGIAYTRGLISRGLAAGLAVVVLGINLGLVMVGPYEVSLLSIPGQRLSNMAPPSLLLAGHSIVLCCLVIACAPWIKSFAGNARVWWFVAIGNSGAMTLYLWHLPAMILVLGISHALGYDRSDPAQEQFVAIMLVQFVAFLILTAVLFALLYRIENLPIPWWDARLRNACAPARSAVIGVIVVSAGVVNTVTTLWGFVPPGTYFVGLLIGLLLLARAIAPVAGASRTP